MSNGVILVDHNEKVLLMNASAQKLLNYDIKTTSVKMFASLNLIYKSLTFFKVVKVQLE
ncbi:PAS domain-containing protein [Peribacillus butanolivorans]|uniref:PAS domain-containing protein n=1 Tax=Peribacillus butanolivorans TaxID=421767 RepID=UPI00365086D1